MSSIYKYTVLFLVLSLLGACKEKSKEEIVVSAQDFYSTVDKVTETMIHDIFSPPVASRIYMYPNIAAYEVMSQGDEKYNSLVGNIHKLTAVPFPKAKVNLKVAAIVAYTEVAKQLVFTDEYILRHTDSLFTHWKKIDKDVFKISRNYGIKVSEHIKKFLDSDNYKESRTYSKFEVFADNPARWQPTPPAYMDGIEPHWRTIHPMVLDSASQFKPAKHPAFSMNKKSDFYKELDEVYSVTNEILKQGDNAEELAIARFWDCNPYVTTSKGHLKVATKKITPGGHWMGITKIASKKVKHSFKEAVYAYTLTSIGMFDAFISCWDEKYRSCLIRPETLINKTIDNNWKPLLQTPPFPEYTSGHSVVSGAASTILTAIFGDNFSYTDSTELPFGLPPRNFSSFNNAAKEAAISRLYGGIHYRAAIDNGLSQGVNLGNHILNSLKLEN